MFAAGKEPVILSGIGNVTASAGKQVKLECDVAFGKPKAQVAWLVMFHYIHDTLPCHRVAFIL